jgi:hypothetical protein
MLGEVLYLEEKAGTNCTTGTLTMFYVSYNIVRVIKYGGEDARVWTYLHKFWLRNSTDKEE